MQRACRRAAASRTGFAGLRSRWTMPSACASAIADARLQHVVDRRRHRQRAARAQHASSRSLAVRAAPSRCTARRPRACRRRRRDRRARSRSCARRARLAHEAIDDDLVVRPSAECRNFSATGVPSWRCVAAITTPIPPCPSRLSIRYLPATTLPAAYTSRSINHATRPGMLTWSDVWRRLCLSAALLGAPGCSQAPRDRRVQAR